MKVQLPDKLAEDLQTVAKAQGRDLDALLEEVVHHYLEWSSEMDLMGDEAAQTQLALLRELPSPGCWESEG